MFVSCCILRFHFRPKQKWTRNGPGCEFHGHLVRRFDAKASLTEAYVPMPNSSNSHDTYLPKHVYRTLKRHVDN